MLDNFVNLSVNTCESWVWVIAVDSWSIAYEFTFQRTFNFEVHGFKTGKLIKMKYCEFCVVLQEWQPWSTYHLFLLVNKWRPLVTTTVQLRSEETFYSHVIREQITEEFQHDQPIRHKEWCEGHHVGNSLLWKEKDVLLVILPISDFLKFSAFRVRFELKKNKSVITCVLQTT